MNTHQAQQLPFSPSNEGWEFGRFAYEIHREIERRLQLNPNQSQVEQRNILYSGNPTIDQAVGQQICVPLLGDDKVFVFLSLYLRIVERLAATTGLAFTDFLFEFFET